jgi:hypothetical protein
VPKVGKSYRKLSSSGEGSFSRAALQRLRSDVAAGGGRADLGAVAQLIVWSLSDVRGGANVGTQTGNGAAGWGRARIAASVLLSVVCDENVAGVAAPANGISSVVIAVTGIVAKPTFVDVVAILDNVITAGVLAQFAAATAATASSLCLSLRVAGPGDGNHERLNCSKGAFSFVPSFENTFCGVGIVLVREST